MDTDKSGTLSKTEFLVALKAFNSVISHPIPEANLETLFNLLDTDGNGEIDYKEFVAAFKVTTN